MQLISALKRMPMKEDESLRIIEPPFEGKRTLIAINDSDVYVGMRSVVEGMGLAWYSQKKKIVNFERASRITYRCRNRHSNALFLERRQVFQYLDEIRTDRIPWKKRRDVYRYKNRFPDFLNEYSSDKDLTMLDSYIDTGLPGMKKLVRDVVTMNYISGYDQLSLILHELMKSRWLNESELTAADIVHEIADYLSKNQIKLKN